jgi:hypothetical protein
MSSSKDVAKRTEVMGNLTCEDDSFPSFYDDDIFARLYDNIIPVWNM